MRAMTRQQIAAYAGMNVRKLYNWFRPFRQEMEQMRLAEFMRLLQPHIVRFIAYRL